MVIIRANALIGPDLKLVEDACIRINEQGVIKQITKEEKTVKYLLPPSYVLIPGLVNAHIHVGDAFLKDQTFGQSLEESVGLTGLKHSKLDSSTRKDRIESIRNSIEMLVSNGYTTFVDFREQGLEGVKLLKSQLHNYPIRSVVLGRNYKNDSIEDVMVQTDGLGFSDVFSLSSKILEKLADMKKTDPEKLVAIHVSESEEIIKRSISKFGKKDIEIIAEIPTFDFVIHATYIEEQDLDLLRKNNIGVVSCPLSNSYYGLDFPPLELIKNKKLLLALGTDNVFSCNPDPFRLMNFVLLGARANGQNFSPKDVLKSLTVNPGLMIRKKIGQIETGFSADFIGFNLDTPNLRFSSDVFSAITMRANTSDIVFQMFKGRLVKWIDQK